MLTAGHRCPRHAGGASGCCHRRNTRSNTTQPATASPFGGGVAAEPPQFDVPERQPTPEELACIAAGAQLTPEQHKAQQLQLPLTQPVRLPPGTPNPRQLMEQIKAATTWQELEAAVYQKQELLALQQQQQQQQPEQTEQPPASEAAAQLQPPVEQSQQQQQLLASESPPLPTPSQPPAAAARKTRRKQPVPVLNVPTSSSLLSGGQVLQPGSSSSTAGQDTPLTPAPGSAPAASTQQQQQQQQQQRREPALNTLHVTEAFRRLPDLLPQQQQQQQQQRGLKLQGAERQRVAALIQHLCTAALHHAQELTLDTRGLAHVLSGLSKLGHKDAALLAELQLAALLRVDEFSSRHTAMLLAALATARVSPDEQLLSALLQHTATTISLFDGQSLVSTIWALARLQELVASTTKATAPTPTVAGAERVGALKEPCQLAQALMCRCDPQMLHWEGRDVAQAAWGLAKLGAQPSDAWRQALLAASGAQMTQMNSQDLANLLAALPALRVLPDQRWLDTLCNTASTKMWLASPMGVHSLLLGLLRLKQWQQRAAAKSAKRQQQQGEQQQKVVAAEAEAAGAGQQADSSSSSTTPPVPSQVAAEAAPAPTAAPSSVVGSLAELRLLRAAVRWLQGHPQALKQFQKAGVITALAELLPPPAAPAQQQQQQPVRDANSKRAAKWLRVHQEVCEVLQQQLLPAWAPEAEALAQSTGGRGRPARYFRLKWAQLQSKCGVESC